MGQYLLHFFEDYFEFWTVDSNNKVQPIKYMESNRIPLYFMVGGYDIEIGNFAKEQYLNGNSATYGSFWSDTCHSTEKIMVGSDMVQKSDLLAKSILSKVFPHVANGSTLEQFIQQNEFFFLAEPFVDNKEVSKLVATFSKQIGNERKIIALNYWPLASTTIKQSNPNISNDLVLLGSYNSDLHLFNLNLSKQDSQKQSFLPGKGTDPRLNAVLDFCITKIIQKGSLLSDKEIRPFIVEDARAILEKLSSGYVEHEIRNPRVGVASIYFQFHRSTLDSRLENPTDLMYIKSELSSFVNGLNEYRLAFLPSPINSENFRNYFQEFGLVTLGESFHQELHRGKCSF